MRLITAVVLALSGATLAAPTSKRSPVGYCDDFPTKIKREAEGEVRIEAAPSIAKTRAMSASRQPIVVEPSASGC
ncbi:hypothetical protein F5B21DRAFT_506462 [Xylaria acuta]|nr:hypothetical protein F5B21DRAFT_506462 [Xylaria acuta]